MGIEERFHTEIVAKTAMTQMPKSCSECDFNGNYINDQCDISHKKYLDGEGDPVFEPIPTDPEKRPDDCPLVLGSKEQP